MTQCANARNQTAAVRRALSALPSEPQNRLGAVVVKPRKTLRIPSSGALAAGTVVLDFDNLKISSSGKLVIAASPDTDQIVLRVANRLRAGRRAHIELEGARPSQLIALVQGPMTIGGSANVVGTLIGADRIIMRRRATLTGALFGRTLLLSGSAKVQRAPWRGWCE